MKPGSATRGFEIGTLRILMSSFEVELMISKLAGLAGASRENPLFRVGKFHPR